MSLERGEAAGRRGSASEGPRCKGRKADGTPCGAPPELVDPETGLCSSHEEGASDRLREAGRRGAEVTKRRYSGTGLADEDLPPLDGPRAAEAWCEVVARAVATGTLGHNEGRTVARLIKEWRESHDAGRVSDRLDRLMSALREWEKTGDPRTRCWS